VVEGVVDEVGEVVAGGGAVDRGVVPAVCGDAEAGGGELRAGVDWLDVDLADLGAGRCVDRDA
jgi:hypothetical protein